MVVGFIATRLRKPSMGIVNSVANLKNWYREKRPSRYSGYRFSSRDHQLCGLG